MVFTCVKCGFEEAWWYTRNGLNPYQVMCTLCGFHFEVEYVESE